MESALPRLPPAAFYGSRSRNPADGAPLLPADADRVIRSEQEAGMPTTELDERLMSDLREELDHVEEELVHVEADLRDARNASWITAPLAIIALALAAAAVIVAAVVARGDSNTVTTTATPAAAVHHAA